MATGSNEEIVDFLRHRGYQTDCLQNVRECRVCQDSIHLLTIADFKSMGVGLADARLLVEKFRAKDRGDELASLVAAVKNKKSGGKERQKKQKLKVDYNWHHWCRSRSKYIQVKLPSGGGKRTYEWDRDVSLDHIFKHMKETYFPKGKGPKGYGSLMLFSLHSADNCEIEDKSIALSDFFESKGLAVRKLILFSKEFRFSDEEGFSSSGDDFEDVKKENVFKSGSEATSSTPNHERRELIQKQDEAYQLSLKADKLKDLLNQEKDLQQKIKEVNEQNRKDEKLHYLKQIQERRSQLVPPEPLLTEPCCVITVIHLSLGRKSRIFPSINKMEDVYNWVGSLCHEPELFELEYGLPPLTADPNRPIGSCEKHVLYMKEVEHSNFTIDIQIPHSSKDVELNQCCLLCPICGSEIPANEIEAHADRCAQQSFPEIIESDSEGESNYEELPEAVSEKRTFNGNIVEMLKTLIDTCSVDKENSLKVKIRRNFAFIDFCERFSQGWIQRKLGVVFKVEFHGECGLDKGGLTREFFSEALESMCTHLFIDSSEGKIPNGKLFQDLADGKFKLAGQLIASSIVMNGPAVPVFAPWLYKYLVGGVQYALDLLPVALPVAGKLSEAYNFIQSLNECDDLKRFCSSDQGLDLLCEIGFRGLPGRVDMEAKTSILKSIFMKDVVAESIPYMQQLAEGLELYGLLDVIRRNSTVFEILFCKSEQLEWTFEKLEELFIPIYSTHGSTRKNKEINTFKAFMDFLEYSYEEGDHECIRRVMKFLTGSSSVPVLGLPSKFSVEFIHGCPMECKCFPSVSTCDLVLKLAVHYQTKTDITNGFDEAQKLSGGFHTM